MRTSSRFNRVSSPKINSPLFSFIAFSFIILIASVLAYPKLEEKGLGDKSSVKVKKRLIKANKDIYSLLRLKKNFPDEPVVLGIYSPETTQFYHLFDEISNIFKDEKKIHFYLANMGNKDHLKILDEFVNYGIISSKIREPRPLIILLSKKKEIIGSRHTISISEVGKKGLFQNILLTFPVETKSIDVRRYVR